MASIVSFKMMFWRTESVISQLGCDMIERNAMRAVVDPGPERGKVARAMRMEVCLGAIVLVQEVRIEVMMLIKTVLGRNGKR